MIGDPARSLRGGFPRFYCDRCHKTVWPTWSKLRQCWVCPFCGEEVSRR